MHTCSSPLSMVTASLDMDVTAAVPITFRVFVGGGGDTNHTHTHTHTGTYMAVTEEEEVVGGSRDSVAWSTFAHQLGAAQCNALLVLCPSD